ncbi:MAG TPA: NAD-dependent dehydratase, partial [Erwinia persicina]|nr:NAD-dependent dehydratase [Erwinia persicina]
MKLLLVGASGLVGGHLLRLALADARVASVVAPVR